MAAIHAQGLVHGDLKPGNVMVTTNTDGAFGKAMVLDFGFAKERARASARRPGAPPDGGTPNYMSPERIRSGGASPEDDVYALGLTLLEMWTCRVPEPGYKPRTKTMRQQIMFDVPSGLSIDEIKQVFRSFSDDPQQRLPARHMRFFNPVTLTTNPIQVPRERLDPGPPPGRSASQAFVPGTQALLVTFATNAPEFVGELVSLDKPVMAIGRRADNDLCVPEATVSGQHAQLRWQNGTWIVEDLGSTNGTYVDHTYERRKSVNLMHGGEVQLGELRFKLVSFGMDSADHKRARAYLGKRDGLTGMLMREQLLRAIDEEARLRGLGRGAADHRALRAARAEPPGERPADHPRDAGAAPRRDARRRADRHAAALAHRRHRRAYRAAALLRGDGGPRSAGGAEPGRAGGRPGARHAARRARAGGHHRALRGRRRGALAGRAITRLLASR